MTPGETAAVSGNECSGSPFLLPSDSTSKSGEVKGAIVGRKEDPALVYCTGVRVTLSRKVREEKQELQRDMTQLQRVDAEISQLVAGTSERVA